MLLVWSIATVYKFAFKYSTSSIERDAPNLDIYHCYIASVNTKRDWLICGHVTSDKCNVSRRATSEKLLPAPTGHVHK